jgi:hypothetical protein
MNRSKKIFAGFVLVFVILLGYAVYDISSRTTFPGSRSKTEMNQPDLPEDSISADSIKR